MSAFAKVCTISSPSFGMKMSTRFAGFVSFSVAGMGGASGTRRHGFVRVHHDRRADAEFADIHQPLAQPIAHMPDAALHQPLLHVFKSKTIRRVGIGPVRADADGIGKAISRLRRDFGVSHRGDEEE